MEVHQCIRLSGRINIFYVILQLLGRVFLEKSHEVSLLFRCDVDHVFRAAHIA